MEITLEPIRVTKELILKKVQQEQLMEHYLGIPVKKGLFKSPLRKDKNPTCAFYWNKNGDLIFKDFGSSFCGNFISVVMEKFQCTFPKALQIIGNDFGIIHNKNLVINKPKLEYTGNKLSEQKSAIIQVEIRPFQDYELAWWASYGISEEILKKFNVYSCKNIFLNGNLFHLESAGQKIFGYYGGIKEGIEQWRLYFVGKKKYKFLSNWKATQIQGAKQLPKEGGDILVITKSLKDCMTLYSLGITAIAPKSENLFITEAQYKKLKTKFKHIILFYDNDAPGIQCMRKIKKVHPELAVMYIPRSYEAKDISDFRKKYGEEKTLKLIEQAKEYYFKWVEKDQAPIIVVEDNEQTKK